MVKPTRGRETESGWRFPGIPLNGGDNEIVLVAWDIAGNRTEISHTIHLKEGFDQLDLTIGDLPVDDLSQIEDIYSNDPSKTIPISGHLDPNSEVMIRIDGKVVFTTTVGADGTWQHDLQLNEINNKYKLPSLMPRVIHKM